MHGSSGCGSKPATQIILTCGNYHKNITNSGCRPNYIDHEILVGLVQEHLVVLEQDFQYLTLKNLYQKQAVARKRWVEFARLSIRFYMMACLSYITTRKTVSAGSSRFPGRAMRVYK